MHTMGSNVRVARPPIWVRTSHGNGTDAVRLPGRTQVIQDGEDPDELGDVRTVRVVVPDRTFVKFIAYVLAALLLVSVARLVLGALVLLVVAMVLAIALDPAVRLLERRLRMSRMTAIGVLFLAGAVLLVGFVLAFVPPLADQTSKLVNEAPRLNHDLRAHHWIRQLDDRYDVVNQATNALQRLPKHVVADAGSVLTLALSSIAGLITLVLLTAFLLIEGGDITRSIVTIWPQVAKRRWWTLVQDSYSSIGGYVSGTLLVALIDGVTVLVLLEVVRAPFALPIALWATIWGILPVVGGFVGSAPAVIAAFSVGTVPGIIVLAVSLGYHLVIRAILHPAIVGRAIALSPFFVFISIVMGEKLLGIIGIVLAIPLAGIAQIVIADLLRERDVIPDSDVELPPIQAE
jgi:predicted PurR-regulated permease PerM